MKSERSQLPFRKNCEGYFFDKKGNVLAKQMDGFLMFPGGGVDENEEIKRALIRETCEETGARVKNVRKVKELKFVWGPNWAKTKKQQERYELFQGEDMHIFVGEIKELKEPEVKKEGWWEGEKLMPIEDAIKSIEAEKPFSNEIKEYRETQIQFLREKKNKA